MSEDNQEMRQSQITDQPIIWIHMAQKHAHKIDKTIQQQEGGGCLQKVNRSEKKAVPPAWWLV